MAKAQVRGMFPDLGFSVCHLVTAGSVPLTRPSADAHLDVGRTLAAVLITRAVTVFAA